MRGQFGGGEATEATLAAPHAAARDGLEAIDLGRPEVGAERSAQLACRDALAAANHRAIIETVDRGNRPRESPGEAALKAA